MKDLLGIGLREKGSFYNGMTQHQAPITGKININHFDVRLNNPEIILSRQFTTNTTITALIMYRIDPDASAFVRIVIQMEHSHLAHKAWAQKLANKALVSVVGPDIAQRGHDLSGTGDVSKPFAIFVS